MSKVLIGCAGFPRRRETYAKRLGFVEWSMPERTPKKTTFAQWRKELGGAFEFAVVVPPNVWGDRSHPLRDAEASRAALYEFAAIVKPLSPSVVVARTPQAVSPGSAALQRFVAFVPALREVARRVVWDPHGLWERPAARKVATTGDMVVTSDPLHDDVARERLIYARMRGLGADRKYHRGKLEDLAMAIAHAESAYIVFDTDDAWREACKLQSIAEGGAEGLDAMAEGAYTEHGAGGDEVDEEEDLDEDDDLDDDEEELPEDFDDVNGEDDDGDDGDDGEGEDGEGEDDEEGAD